jgi:GntR family transcriptional regulator
MNSRMPTPTKVPPLHAPSESPSESRRPGPLYAQIVDSLKQEILSGIHAVGTQLPSEDELAERFSVSRHTIREALRRLRDDGLVASRKGAGTTVMRPGSSQSYVHEVASINDLISFVSALRFAVDSIEMVVSSTALAKRIGGEKGQKWLKLEGFRYATGDDKPVCWMEVFVHEDYAGVGRLIDQNKGPVFELIETVYGERIVEVEQVIRTSPMPKGVAAPLGVQPSELSVEVARTFRLGSGKTAEVSVAHYPGASFMFSMKLRRTK